MKPLVPWTCLFLLSSSALYAEDNLQAYRLGQYHKAAATLQSNPQNDAVTDYYLGRMALYGYGQLRNTTLALRYFLQSAEKGYLPAVQLLASYRLLQDKDQVEAIRWYKKAAEAGDVQAQMFMAAAYLYGIGVKANEDVARKYYIDAAKNGNTIAQFTLAEHFLDAKHAANKQLGLIWLSKSANNGNSRAQVRLGTMYLEGKGVEKDPEKGLNLLQSAAAKNLTSAMLVLGNAELEAKNYPKAMEWFNKAASQKDAAAYLALGTSYLLQGTPVYDPKSGFMWTLKAAQDGLPMAMTALAQLYEKGIGTPVDAHLATEWAQKAKAALEKKDTTSALSKAARWLSDGAANTIEATGYQMKGILNPWKNARALRDNIYNPAPRREVIAAQDLFKPQFALIKPSEVPFTQYFDALNKDQVALENTQWAYPLYPLNKDIAALEKEYSPIVYNQHLPAPYLDASYFVEEEPVSANVIDWWMPNWQKQANYYSVFSPLYFKALLGDTQSQFEIGQMFQYGIGVEKNLPAAIIFYQNAAEQQNLGAEYNLGVLYLKNPELPESDKLAANWLTDAAFKGNKQAQYVLSKILVHGKNDAKGKPILKANPEQATSMLYLAAANEYGPAQYELAFSLSRQSDNGLNVVIQQQKNALIRSLYESAVINGVTQALLPLAFYNAMDTDKQRQTQAFTIAQSLAQLGDEKAALLLGMLYDRGIGVSMEPAKALYWYQRAGSNAVSQFILGTYQSEGQGMPEDKTRGMALLKQAADARFSYADFNLAALKQRSGEVFLPYLITAYELGNSLAGIVLADYYLATSKDPSAMKQAMQIYQSLAEKGDSNAQLKLGYMLDNALGVPKNAGQAQAWYLASASQGNPYAQYLLGQWYQAGEVGEPDYALAKDWYLKAATKLPQALVAIGFIEETVFDNNAAALQNYEKAAALGDVIGVYDSGLMYLEGKGIPLDYPKAKILLTDAANKGVVQAMYELAGMYFNGLGQAKDEQQALVWYKKAAEASDANAQYQLGLLSETGYATKMDLTTALSYYEKAASQNNQRAQLALARMYHYGIGTPRDLKKAAALYQQLAEQGNAYAQYRLGTFYIEGTVVERSPDKGRQWLQKACDNGNKQAREALQRLDAKTLTRTSFLLPVHINNTPSLIGVRPDLAYFKAMNEWNKGDEVLSRMILQRLVTQYPHFMPAKRAFEQLGQA